MSATRQAVSKKTRFDVFKRDGFTCAYCGATPPSVILECDHIHPVAEGGSNDADNLVTACEACNRGKGARLLSDVPRSLAEKACEVEEREAQIAGYEAIMREKRARIDREAQDVLNDICDRFNRDSIPNVDFLSIKRFIARIGVTPTLEAVDIAHVKFRRSYRSMFKYFCGVCWRKIRQAEGENGPNS